MHHLRLRLDLQSFGRVLLAVSVEGTEGRDPHVPGVLIENEYRSNPCRSRLIVHSIIVAAQKPLQPNVNRSCRRVHVVFSSRSKQRFNNALAGRSSC
jgi:hypothetical protein